MHAIDFELHPMKTERMPKNISQFQLQALALRYACVNLHDKCPASTECVLFAPGSITTKTLIPYAED